MATPISSFSLRFLPLLVLFFSTKTSALDRDHALNTNFHTFQVTSLLPPSVCTPSPTGNRNRRSASLNVVNRHGPCSHLKQDKVSAPTATEILSQDESRVNSIHARLSFNSGRDGLRDSKATLPAKSGSSLGTANYVAVIGLGTPKNDYSLVFDTGSDLTWTQCQPCLQCYNQKDPKFDPSLSKTYKNITCNSAQCSQLRSATGNSPGCSGTTCIYAIQYGDQSFSVGYFSTDTLTFGSDAFPDFFFGCGQKNRGLFGGTAGLLGLGRDRLSLISQTASKYGKYFSYCLPTSSESDGFLTLGKGSTSKALKFTPFSSNSQGPSFYFIDITGIKVGGQVLSISQSVFKTAGTIIDSGTVISRLPPAAYSALRTSFRQQMSKYSLTQPLSILDTCYDLSNYTTISVPKISFYFGGNVEVALPVEGILKVGGGVSQVCLAFAGNSDDSDVGIFGNLQQLTMEVAYDVAGGKLGFGEGACS